MECTPKQLNLLRAASIATAIVVIGAGTAIAQQKAGNDSLKTEIDITDILRKWAKKPAKSIDTPHIGARNLSILPVLGYSPANGFLAGAAVSVTKFMGNPKSTQLSTALINLSVTAKDQLLLYLRYDLYTPQNKWYISGDNRLMFFTQPTHGLGIRGLHDLPNTFSWNSLSTTTHGDLEQPMKFNYLRLYETFLRKIKDSRWYAGMGVMIDYNFKIRDDALKLDSPATLTSHYIYSKTYNFNPDHYNTNGLSAQVMHDNRDDPVTPYKGYYLNVSYRVNPKTFGSSQSSSVLYYEYRTYINIDKKIPRNLIAFWLWGTNVVSGRMPYLELPSLGWDAYNRSGRGYIQGRFRGSSMFYAESELRFQITRNGLLGGVAFLDCTTASNPLPLTGQALFNTIAPGGGVGLRLKMNKRDRTNLTMDYGAGHGFSGIYLNMREAF